MTESFIVPRDWHVSSCPSHAPVAGLSRGQKWALARQPSFQPKEKGPLIPLSSSKVALLYFRIRKGLLKQHHCLERQPVSADQTEEAKVLVKICKSTAH